jgi:hypothetical protein
MAGTVNYRKLNNAAYIYFMALSLLWVVIQLWESHHLNTTAAIAFGVFVTMAKINNRIVNLIVGILLLLASIFGTLDFIAWGGNAGFDIFIKTMIGVGFLSVAASVVLIFSFLRLSFEDK